MEGQEYRPWRHPFADLGPCSYRPPPAFYYHRPIVEYVDSGRIDYAKTQDAGEDIRFIDSDGVTVLLMRRNSAG